MKKILPIIFVVLLLFSAGCSRSALSKNTTREPEPNLSVGFISTETKEKPKKDVPNWDAKRTEETLITENEENIFSMNPEYEQISLNLKNQTASYKTFGRTYFSENGLNVDFGGKGFEFEAECGGDIYVTYSSAQKTYFQSFVDGEPAIRFSTEVDTNGQIRIAKNIEDGVHMIRIVRDTDAVKNSCVMAFDKVTFYGKEETLKAPLDKDLYIEFVGDSITAGKYTEMKYIEGDAIHKATNSYAYLTATALNADFSMLSRGGCGYFRVSTCPKTMNQLYPYYNGFANDPILYTPTRKADVVVLALGTNDGSSNVKDSYEKGIVPFASFDEALADQINQIRVMHGENVPIVLMYGMMSTTWEKEFKLAAEADNVYLLKVTKNREGGKNHPSSQGHKVIASELTKFIQENFL